MKMRSIWVRKHGLSLMQRRQIEHQVAMEHVARQQEDEMFRSIANAPRLLAELDCEREKFCQTIEARITQDGWKPTDSDWDAIKQQLAWFAERRRAIDDPHGIKSLADALSLQKKHKPSTFDLYLAFGPRMRRC